MAGVLACALPVKHQRISEMAVPLHLGHVAGWLALLLVWGDA